MTSPPFPSGMDDHPEVDEISAFTEGQLTPERSTAVREHLAACALCADVRDSLDGIRELLGTVPGPSRMPEDVASRIDAALAAEALLNATAPDEAADVSRGTELSGDKTQSPDRESHVADVSRGCTPSGDSTRTSGREPQVADVSRETSRRAGARPPGRPHGASGPGRRRGPRRWRAALIAVGALAGIGLGGTVMYAVSGTGSDNTTADRSGHPQEASEYQDGGDANTEALGKRVRALLKEGDGPSTASGSPKVETKQSPGGESPLRDGGATTMPSCVKEGIGRTEAPIAADSGVRYRGGPGYLVVLPHVGDPRLVDAYIVDPACTTGSKQGPGEVLTKHTYTRR